MDRIALLQKIFPGMSAEVVTRLIDHAEEKTYPVGSVLCHEGAVETTFYVITDGRVEITKWIEFAQEERFLRHSETGDFFGEMAIINDAPRAATVRAIVPTTVLEIDRERFLTILSDNPLMALALVRTTLDRMQANDQMRFEELRKTYESLQRLDQAKLDFIEVAAHELRTPLTVIQGYSKVISASVQQNDSIKEMFTGLQEGVNRMLQVVNAMLDVTRIDSKTLKVAAVPVLPKLVANEALNTFNDAIESRRIEVVRNHEQMPTLPYIYADPSLINKLFYQLLSNAIKYTPDGGKIEISTREVTDPRIGGQGVEIVVKDSGVGISDQHIRYIFDKFYQGGDVSLHSSSKSAFMGGGPGLGLAIARGIVEAHKGVIWAESPGNDPQKLPGTTFYVLLPVGEAG